MRKHPPIWVLVSVAWIGPGILAAFTAFMAIRYGGWKNGTWHDILFQGGDWLIYGLITPLVFLFSRRFPLSRANLWRYLPLHFVGSILLGGVWSGTGEMLRYFLIPQKPFPTADSMVGWFFDTLPFGALVYFAVLGVERAAHYFVESQEKQDQLTAARLGALRMQLQPHFLLNSLNAITVIVRDRDTATATRMLELLGDMLRRVMRADRPQEVSLTDEVEFARQYLAIEAMRFSDRLEPSFEIPAELAKAAVPEFLLQPLVENAIRHGVAKREGVTRVRIAAQRDGGDLVLTVTDRGAGATEIPGPEGVGLSNTRARLTTLYGARGLLDLALLPDGVNAAARLPYHELPPA